MAQATANPGTAAPRPATPVLAQALDAKTNGPVTREVLAELGRSGLIDGSR